jgi:Ciliary basal body-associated, B9 protein
MSASQVDFGEFEGYDNLYCRYTLSYGHDWSMVHGLETGLSQIARRSSRCARRSLCSYCINFEQCSSLEVERSNTIGNATSQVADQP